MQAIEGQRNEKNFNNVSAPFESYLKVYFVKNSKIYNYLLLMQVSNSTKPVRGTYNLIHESKFQSCNWVLKYSILHHKHLQSLLLLLFPSICKSWWNIKITMLNILIDFVQLFYVKMVSKIITWEVNESARSKLAPEPRGKN